MVSVRGTQAEIDKPSGLGRTGSSGAAGGFGGGGARVAAGSRCAQRDDAAASRDSEV
jgi:hypothetical protein